ncbi:Coatomer subunit beta [Fasciola hepatica]|uniref:Coatomer subunit beta n=1 Tax=Fasciola hepatica TaxID=6192 RepID=A0A4E0REP7_FASHE|nr:Coatomer subunit beta [Fasciola hepatica]
MAADQVCFTLIGLSPEAKSWSEQQLKDDLQSNNIDIKRDALKEVIRLIVNGERFSNLLMTVIRFVMPSQDHMVKKLLLLFWEVVPKYGPDGKLLQEMILVCDAYRKDLQHPNEYIRGSTLRFLCKLKEPELLEPLMPAIQQCLEHRHAYVRRNAVLAIFTIYKNFDHLIPDAPEKMLRFLEQEQDASCKRNAFMMLLHVSQSSALEYLVTRLDQVHNFGDILQLIIVELIYKVCHTKPSERLRFIRCIYTLLQSSSPAVRYEAAGTLITLSAAPSALKAAASCYINLILKESDNNVKLIVLSRLKDLRRYHERILQDLVMDIVQILAASDMEIRQQTLDLTMDLVTLRTADELVKLYKKELLKACSGTDRANAQLSVSDANGEKTNNTSNNSDETTYRYALVHTIYDISIRFPTTLANIIPTICDILTYEEVGDSKAAVEACRFIREVLHRFPQRKSEVLEKLMQVFPSIAGQETLRHVLWIFGEFCTSLEEINTCITLIRQVIGDLPLVDEELRRQTRESGDETQEGVSALLSSDVSVGPNPAQRVTADGTYATQTALTSIVTKAGFGFKNFKRPVLQAALFDVHYLPGVVLSVCLVKLFYRYVLAVTEKEGLLTDSSKKVETRENSFAAECMLVIASMLHLAQSGILSHQVNPDHVDRMWICLKVLADRRMEVLEAFDKTSRACLAELVTYQETERKQAARTRNQSLEQHHREEAQLHRADAPVRFSLLVGQSEFGDLEDRFDLTLSQALGATVKGGSVEDAYATSKLSKVRQLTGFSDPVYAEAYVHVNQFDIMLDVLIVNQTRDTLQNLTLELSTLGDLRLVEKPSPLTIAPQDFANIKANIKVSSTENGIIFGNISYDVRGSTGETTCIVLNDIHIDIMEYILPATCSPAEFRQMWSEFEWENKVTVNTQIKDLFVYLTHITKHTNLRCLTPMEALRGECDYLCVTLYARTIFGEHVLANLCLEKTEVDQPVTGHVRIRAKTQGMAVTMGEKVSTSQKNWSGTGSQGFTQQTHLETSINKFGHDEDAVGVMRSHSPAPLIDTQ